MNWVCKDWSAAPHHNYLAVVPWVQNTLNDGLILTTFITGKDVVVDLTEGSFWFLSDYFA